MSLFATQTPLYFASMCMNTWCDTYAATCTYLSAMCISFTPIVWPWCRGKKSHGSPHIACGHAADAKPLIDSLPRRSATGYSSLCLWRRRHFRVPVWTVWWPHYWHLDLRSVLTLPHSAMMDCSAEWLWQGGPYRLTAFSPTHCLSGEGGLTDSYSSPTCLTWSPCSATPVFFFFSSDLHNLLSANMFFRFTNA